MRHVMGWVAGIALAAGAAFAAETAEKKDPSIYDKAWSYMCLYEDEKNPVLESLRITGRFQGDYATVDADQGDHDEWNVRRLRLGGKAKIVRTLTLHGEADLNPQEADPMYQRITDAYLAWSQDTRFTATVGKQSAPFTLDGSTSSKELLTIDRNNVANNLWFPGEWAWTTGLRVAW